MLKPLCACLLLATASRAAAAGQDAAPPPIATGTPSDATATVSPTTVAQAASRPDAARDGDAPGLELSLGSSIAHGDFGTGQDSRIISSALGARLSLGTLRLSASVPYMNIRGRGLVFSGIDSTPIIAAGALPGAARVTHDGIGDLTLGAAYALPEHGDLPEIELSGRVKLPTATDASHLSTGKTDYSLGVQASKTYGAFAPFVAATYRLFGQTELVDLKDGFAASAGTSISVSRRTVALLSYHYAAAATRLVRDAHELFAGCSTLLPHSRLRLTAFATAGLSSGAAASSGGVSLSLGL